MTGAALLIKIYLLTGAYSYIERALLVSRRRFGVNMGFSDDQILIKNVYISKVVEQKNILWNFRCFRTLNSYIICLSQS